MLLTIDAGNLHTMIGVFRDDVLVGRARISTSPRTTDELGALLLQILAHRGVAADQLQAGVCCSVVPRVTYTLEKACRTYLGVSLQLVGPGLRTGLRIRTENPREVGGDRIANAVAAQVMGPGPAVIVDLGAATLVDCVSAEGDYVGGLIAPGLQLSLDALAERTARLPHVEIVRPRVVIGRSTAGALQAGMYWGLASMVDGLARRCREELGGQARVIATGEWAALLAPSCAEVQQVEPDLTLRGLAELHRRNPAA